MKVAAGAVLLAAVVVLVSLAVVFVLVRADLLSAGVWSFYPVILALCLAGVFAFAFFGRRRSQKGNGGTP